MNKKVYKHKISKKPLMLSPYITSFPPQYFCPFFALLIIYLFYQSFVSTYIAPLFYTLNLLPYLTPYFGSL